MVTLSEDNALAVFTSTLQKSGIKHQIPEINADRRNSTITERLGTGHLGGLNINTKAQGRTETSITAISHIFTLPADDNPKQ